MNNLDRRIAKIDRKLDEVGKSIIALQDTILELKTVFETLNRRRFEKEYLAELTLQTKENVDKFLRDTPPNCDAVNQCIRGLEKASFVILQTFMEKGTESALGQVRSHREAAKRHYKEFNCLDDECFKNAVNVFETLEKILKTAEESSSRLPSRIYAEHTGSAIKEKEICNLLSPLTNEIRLKILKSLGKGGKSHAQLAQRSGAKGGHLQFHLDRLLQAGYVIQEKPKGRYLITRRGLKTLRFVSEINI